MCILNSCSLLKIRTISHLVHDQLCLTSQFKGIMIQRLSNQVSLYSVSIYCFKEKELCYYSGSQQLCYTQSLWDHTVTLCFSSRASRVGIPFPLSISAVQQECHSCYDSYCVKSCRQCPLFHIMFPYTSLTGSFLCTWKYALKILSSLYYGNTRDGN